MRGGGRRLVWRPEKTENKSKTTRNRRKTEHRKNDGKILQIAENRELTIKFRHFHSEESYTSKYAAIGKAVSIRSCKSSFENINIGSPLLSVSPSGALYLSPH